METGWKNSFCCGTDGSTGTITGGDDIVGQNCNFTNNAWDIRDISTTSAVTPQVGTRCYDYSNHATAARVPESSVVQALLFGNGVGSSYTHHNIPDPHMMCLKLGKRHYCDCLLAAELSSDAKRVKPPPYPTTVWASSPVVRVTSLPTTVVPRCQVEGCHVALANSKDYYKRHKVCEIHSKAPKVVVLGLQQRFCQQCSRFHGVTEFDQAKRSCRRRLEGHNQRRRKGTPSNSLPRNFPHSHENNPKMEGQIRPLSPLHSKPGCALSLLSSPKTEPWNSSDDLSSRCSAALCELIAANRATYYVGHFMNQKSSNQQVIENKIHTLPPTHMWDRFSVVDPKNTTLNLMQAPALDFDLLSMKEKSKDSEEWTDYCWSTFGGTNFV